MTTVKKQDQPTAALAIFANGFRPFFLLGAAFAFIAIALWLPEFYGDITIRTAFTPVAWHIHEMLFGYLAAAVTGFLLTAIPNWTGRLPIRGRPLMLLVALWLIGRATVSVSEWTGWFAAMIVDFSFLLTVLLVIVREIVGGNNLRNLKVAVLVGVLAISNIAFHVEAHVSGAPDYATRAGIAGMLLLVMIIGGRIIPSFTRNWLARQPPGRMPVTFGRFDIAVIVVSAVALLAWVLFPEAKATAEMSAIAGILQLVRLTRWAGERTWPDRLVLVLHVAYLFVPVGFLLLSASIVFEIPRSAAVHAWTVGAMATLTLAVMTRATLGHTGRTLEASAGTQIVYGAVVVAALARIPAALFGSQSDGLLHFAALAWMMAFATFLMVFGPMLVQRREG
ncbi:MAG: NnrS family protein [Afipia sp.]|nr:NnrS family protein [Afipia sp.]